MNGGPWYSQLHKSGLHWAGFLFIALLLICCLVPVVAAEQVSENSKAAVVPSHIYPYTGFKCLDKAPCFGGRLSFSMQGFGYQYGMERPFSQIEINWGDGSAAEVIVDPPTLGKKTHIYNKPRNYTITVTGRDNGYYYKQNLNSYVQNYTLDLSLMKGDILVHAIDDDSPYSSTFSPYVPGHWTHAAMYVGDDQVIEAGWHWWNDIHLNSVSEWVYPADECVAIYRVPGLTNTQRDNIVNWAKEKLGRGYDLQSLTGRFSGKQQDNDDYPCIKYIYSPLTYATCKWACSNYYCSELVWAAYRRNGIDFDPEKGCVYPMDLVLSKHVKVVLVGTHIEKTPKRIKAYSTTDRYYMLLISSDVGAVVKDITKSGSCETCGTSVDSGTNGYDAAKAEVVKNMDILDPVNTRITDPDRRYMTESYSTIPDSTTETVDIDGDNIAEMMDSIQNAKGGNYLISVSPDTKNPQDYYYSLRIGAWDNDQISWIEPVNFTGLSSLPEGGNIRLHIEENGYCRMIGAPTRGTAPFNVSFMDISPLMRSDEDWDYEDTVINNLWDFGDGTFAKNLDSVAHEYTKPGSYQVSLTTRNATLEASAVMTVVIDAPLQPLSANFTSSPLSGKTPLTVKFADTSTGDPTMLVYDFGDGTTITGKSPSHTYRNPGTYTVTLTVVKKDSSGKVVSNSTVKKDLITVLSK